MTIARSSAEHPLARHANQRASRSVSGKERDAESGSDNFVAGYYSSSLRRFRSHDPENIGASEDDPQSWNAYAYAGNNPLSNIDPDGRADCHEVSDADGGGLKVICTDSVTVTADQPNSEPVMTAETRTIVQHIGQAAQKSYDYLRAAYEAFVKSRTACVVAATAAGAYAAGYPLAETGAAGGAAVGAFGGPFDEVTVPAGSALGGLALGGYGAVKGGQVGYALGQAGCSSGTGSGGGGGNSGGSANVPGNPFKGKDAAEQAVKHLKRFHGIDPAVASERLHRIKEAAGLGAADNAIIGRTGDVYNPYTGAWIGSLTGSH